MGAVMNPDRLRRELMCRGWTGSDLARAAGLSAPTITAALAGRPIAPNSIVRIAMALTKGRTIEGVDQLLG